MRANGQLGPLTRARLWWDASRDARGGLTPEDPCPRAAAYESAAEARKGIISLRLERKIALLAATLARLIAEQDHLSRQLSELPLPDLITERPETAVDAVAVMIRANTRSAERRLALTEHLRRLEIEVAGNQETIAAKKRAALAQQDAAAQFGKACRDIYLANLQKHTARQRNVSGSASKINGASPRGGHG